MNLKHAFAFFLKALGCAVVVLALWFIVEVNYSKFHKLVFGAAHRITAHNISSVLSAIMWPLVVFTALLLLRSELRDLINRFRRGKFGNFEGEFGDSSPGHVTDTAAPAVSQEVKILSAKVATAKQANNYWLGKDMMQTIDLLLRGAPRDRIVWQIKQAQHHLKESGLNETVLQVRMAKIVSDADATVERDWNDARRLSVARDIESLLNDVGQVLNASQPGFKPNP